MKRAAAFLFGVLVFVVFPPSVLAARNTAIGLTGGAPTTSDGQATVAAAGVSWISWNPRQVVATPLDARLKLRVQMRRSMTVPVLAGVGGYSAVDEPILNHIPALFVRAQVLAIHAAGSVAITNQGWPYNGTAPTVALIRSYPGDILSEDSYPTARHPFARVGPRVARMVAASKGRPVWAVLEVCSTKNFKTGAVPGPLREWKMAKAALDAGASGISFYGGGYPECFKSAQDTADGFNWTAWDNTVLPTIRRIRAYAS